ncbi:MAG: NAD(+) diphosphatase [Oscillospiraceae bacterium]
MTNTEEYAMIEEKIKGMKIMLQDISTGRLENEFRNIRPQAEDIVLCFQNQQMLLRQLPEESKAFPTFSAVKEWTSNWTAWFAEGFRYVFRLQDQNYFVWLGNIQENVDADYCFEPVRSFREILTKEQYYASMTGWHLYNWYRSNKFCGNCGSKTVHDDAERMLRCPDCGNMIFPRISPAVIVAITDGDRLLMSKYAGRGFTRYALIAGYTEIGETMEQTVQREVMEEVGLRVKNIRYYKSQPWGIDGNVLMGFYCDLDGDDTIHLDEKELALAEWHHRGALPAKDDGLTLTREMIRVFDEGREPK